MLSSPRGLRVALAIHLHRHHHHLRFHYCSVTSSSTLSVASPSDPSSLLSYPSSSTLSPCFLSLFLLRSVAPRCSSSSLSCAARRRPDERDNSSSIRLSTASLFGPLPITLFLLLSAFVKTSTRYRRRGSECSLQLQSGAMHSRDASTRRGVR